MATVPTRSPGTPKELSPDIVPGQPVQHWEQLTEGDDGLMIAFADLSGFLQDEILGAEVCGLILLQPDMCKIDRRLFWG